MAAPLLTPRQGPRKMQRRGWGSRPLGGPKLTGEVGKGEVSGKGQVSTVTGAPGAASLRTHTLRQSDRVTDTHPHTHNTHAVPLVLMTTPPKAHGLVALPDHRHTSLHAPRRPTAPEPSPLCTCVNKRQA